MKALIVTMTLLMASSGLAEAQSLRSNSASSSDALAAAQSAAGAISSSQGGNVTFNNQASPASTRHEGRIHNTYGTQTIRSAPQVVAPSMSSGHPCAYAPVSVGISVVGFGGAFGGQRIDDACLLAQMGIGNAGMVMIAARNPAACQALMAVGRIRSCGGRQAVRTVAYQPAPAPMARPQVRRAVAVNSVVTAGYPTQKVQYVKKSSLKKGQLYRKVPGGKLYRKG